jgi:hypothetical protein
MDDILDLPTGLRRTTSPKGYYFRLVNWLTGYGAHLHQRDDILDSSTGLRRTRDLVFCWRRNGGGGVVVMKPVRTTANEDRLYCCSSMPPEPAVSVLWKSCFYAYHGSEPLLKREDTINLSKEGTIESTLQSVWGLFDEQNRG